MKSTVKDCQNINHLLGILLFLGVLLLPFIDALAAEKLQLSWLNPYARVQVRGPSNFVPGDEVSDLPIETKLWYHNILAEDNAGVLRGVRETYLAWEKEEEYARNWNLTSTGLYKVRTQSQRKAVVNSKIFKYLDKRLSGEIKQASDGSTLANIGKVQKALKPDTKVQVSKNVKLKFKARVLQGKAMMYVVNPYVDNETKLDAKGNVSTNVKYDIGLLGVSSNLEYKVSQGRWTTNFDKNVAKHIKARLSSSQSDGDLAFTSKSNTTFQLFFNRPF